MSDLWFTKEQIEAEEKAGRFNSPWDERSFRSRILQDWLTMYAEITRLKETITVSPRQKIESELRTKIASLEAKIKELNCDLECWRDQVGEE